MTYRVSCKKDKDWLRHTLSAVRDVGFMVVEDVLDHDFLQQTRDAMYQTQELIYADIAPERRASEVGVLRLMMQYNHHFIKFLEIPEVLAVVDNTVSDTAILHLQNGFILPSHDKSEKTDVFQTRYHMDIPRVLNGYLMSINTLFMIDDFTNENGGTLVLPGSHQREEKPDQDYMDKFGVQAEGRAGAMIVFDSTVWHAAGQNVSGADRKGINHQFTRSYLKQQVDYVRALGDDVILAQKSRTQQLLGYYTRVIKNLDEYYQPPEKRLYRGGQG